MRKRTQESDIMRDDLKKVLKRIEKNGYAITSGEIARELSKKKKQGLHYAHNRRKKESVIYKMPF